MNQENQEQEQAGQQVKRCPRCDSIVGGEDASGWFACSNCGWNWHPKQAQSPAQPDPTEAQEWTVEPHNGHPGLAYLFLGSKDSLVTLNDIQAEGIRRIHNQQLATLCRELEEAKEKFEEEKRKMIGEHKYMLDLWDHLSNLLGVGPDEDYSLGPIEQATNLRTRLAEAERTIITQGKQCAVSITGFPDDEGEINSVESAMKAIQAELKLGRESHNKLAEAEKDKARLDWLEQHWNEFLLWAHNATKVGLSDLRQAIDSAQTYSEERLYSWEPN